MKFSDLQFEKIEGFNAPGRRARASFPNGYGASVVSHANSYGGRDGLYELAVIDAGGELCYDTPVTSDVEGWCTEERVEQLLAQIEAL